MSCIDRLCTHEAAHLADGPVMGYEVECRKHSGAFDDRTGEALRMPPCINLKTCEAETGGVAIRVRV